MRLKNYLNEENDGFEMEEVVKIVTDNWKKMFPDSYVSQFKGGLDLSDYAIVTFRLGKDKSEYINSIGENDPLSLKFNISTYPDQIVVEMGANSLSIKPENPHMAYGRKKINVRKFRAKDLKTFEKKVVNVFKKVKDTVKDAIDKDEFSVYKDDIQKMIQSKVK